MSEAGEIIKSGAVEKIADLVNKLAGPMADEVDYARPLVSTVRGSVASRSRSGVLFWCYDKFSIFSDS